jgi:hypothetical protein
MRYVDSLPGSRSHKLLAASLLLLILITVVGAPARIARTYQAGSSVVLLASPAASKINGGNPYLSFSPSLTLTAELISQELVSPNVARRLATEGITASPTVTVASYGTTTTGSVLLLSVTGRSMAQAEHDINAVTAQISKLLATMQAGERRYDRIRAATLAMDQKPRASEGPVVRALAIVVGLELAAGFAVFRLSLAFSGRRRRREGYRLGSPAATGYAVAAHRVLQPRANGEGRS